MKRSINLIVLLSTLLAWTAIASANEAAAPTIRITMDCMVYSGHCNFNPGDLGSPEYGAADFSPVAPGWNASFSSMPAISWINDGTGYYAEFGSGGSIAINAPNGLHFTGTLTSGLAITLSPQIAETVAWFDGFWSSGQQAQGLIAWENINYPNSPVTLEVNTVPEPSTFLLFGSAVAGCAGTFKRRFTGR